MRSKSVGRALRAFLDDMEYVSARQRDMSDLQRLHDRYGELYREKSRLKRSALYAAAAASPLEAQTRRERVAEVSGDMAEVTRRLTSCYRKLLDRDEDGDGHDAVMLEVVVTVEFRSLVLVCAHLIEDIVGEMLEMKQSGHKELLESAILRLTKSEKALRAIDADEDHPMRLEKKRRILERLSRC